MRNNVFPVTLSVQSVVARGEASFAKRRRQQATALKVRACGVRKLACALFRGSLLPHPPNRQLLRRCIAKYCYRKLRNVFAGACDGT
jgi:hypothetical protein